MHKKEKARGHVGRCGVGLVSNAGKCIAKYAKDNKTK